jgi:hypothetical protein
MARSRARKRVLQAGLALAEHRELRRQRDERVNRSGEQVDAFLVREARDHADERHAGVASQVQAPLQRGLVRGLALERARVVALRDARIARGSHTTVSIPFRMPLSTSCRCRSRPSMPWPNSGVWISDAYVGLTVVTASALAMPPFEEREPAVELDAVDGERRGRQLEGSRGAARRNSPGRRDCGSSSPTPRVPARPRR